MKRIEKIFVSMTSLGILFNNIVYAAEENVANGTSRLPTKYIFIGIAAIVIVLLLFLGYKMDTKGNESVSKASSKKEKTEKKLIKKAEQINKKSETYEDNEDIPYEADKEEDFDNDDLNDSMEYKEDDESIGEFDTSIIDRIDEKPESTDIKKGFDETMLFDNSILSSTGNNLENEIDSLENFDDSETITETVEDDNNDFITKLKEFEEPESDFKGFSVASNKVESKKINPNEEKNNRNKVDELEDISLDNDFLSQMESNLQKNQEDRKSKKNPNKKED